MTTTQIPPSTNSGSNWQFASVTDGQIRTKDRDGTKETHDKIEGTLGRIGIHRFEWNGETISNLEAEVKTVDGENFCVQVGLKSSVATGMFGSALMECKAGDFIAIRASRSKEPNKWGKHMTFMEVQRYNPEIGKWAVLKPSKDEYPGDTWQDKQPALLEALEKHPAYAEREARVSDREATEYDLADAQLRGQGWPSLTAPGAPEVYLGLFNKALKTSYKDYAGIGDNEWNELRRAMAGKPCPKSLEKFLSSDPVEEFDPFADE